jgi:hypothetical protein
MSRRSPSTFRQTDVTRAVKAVVAAGQPVARVKISKDEIVVIVGAPATDPEADKPAQLAQVLGANEWDTIE